jgi:hypothetical protein
VSDGARIAWIQTANALGRAPLPSTPASVMS